MSIIGFVVLVVLILLGIWIYMALGAMPGQKARERSHPQADAINVLGWVGLLLGVVPWLIALVWAHMNPILGDQSSSRDDA
jgi:Na+-driven multidrug efflux pump